MHRLWSLRWLEVACPPIRLWAPLRLLAKISTRCLLLRLQAVLILRLSRHQLPLAVAQVVVSAVPLAVRPGLLMGAAAVRVCPVADFDRFRLV